MVEVTVLYIRIDLTKPCSIACKDCGYVMSRGDSAIVGNGDYYCMDCGKDKLTFKDKSGEKKMVKNMGIYTTTVIEDIIKNAKEDGWTKNQFINTIVDIWDKTLNLQTNNRGE